MMVANDKCFHVMDSVVVGELHGYIFSFAEAEAMALVKSYDGKVSEWLAITDLTHFVYVADVVVEGDTDA